ncbi:hypothetical protein [Streptomyces sp. NBC_01483]|nr:hypothetical protein [Streptomyces sp. NBC_01483]
MNTYSADQNSYWIKPAPAGNLRPPVDTDLTVDVAVIGAGITCPHSTT